MRLHATFFVTFQFLSGFAVADPVLGINPAIPANLQITTFATGLNFPYGMYQLPDGSILAATSNGSLFGSPLQIDRITQTNGVANAPTVVFNGGAGPATGLTGVGNIVAVATGIGTGSQIVFLQAGAGGSLTQIGQMTFSYPAGLWWHNSHAIAMRAVPGQPNTYQLAFSVGSQFNDQASVDTVGISGLTSATLTPDSVYRVSFTVNGSTLTPGATSQVASGLRNAFALGFNANGDLHIGDNGIDLNGTNVPVSSDEFDKVPAGSGVLNFGFPNVYIDPVTGMVIGNPAGTTLPFMSFLPLSGAATQGVAGLALSPSGFPAGLNNGAFFGFFGRHEGGTANDLTGVVYVDATTGKYFDFLPGAQNGVGHPVSLLSTADALYIADLSTIGVDSAAGAGTGVIFRVSLSSSPEPSTFLLFTASAILAGVVRRYLAR